MVTRGSRAAASEVALYLAALRSPGSTFVQHTYTAISAVHVPSDLVANSLHGSIRIAVWRKLVPGGERC